MYKFLYVVLFIPLLTKAQTQTPVNPVISPDYLSLINNDSLPFRAKPAKDSTKTYGHIRQPYNPSDLLGAFRDHAGTLTLIPERRTTLALGGNYTIAAAMRTANAMPLLKTTPCNDIFRTGFMMSHYLTLNANIYRPAYRPPIWAFSVKAALTDENMVIQNNRNATNSLSLSAERNVKMITISGAYNYFSSSFSNDNSNGFLNRVYENALLTPVSYNNAQSLFNFNTTTDNPWFLLKNNGHVANRVQQTGSLSLQKKQGMLTFGLTSSLDALDANSNQSLKAGTAFFPAGLAYLRKQDDLIYSVNTFVAEKIRYNNYHFGSTLRLNYIYNKEETKITNIPTNAFYTYSRITNDADLSLNTVYDNDNLDLGFNAGNKFYRSTTSSKNSFFLPELSGLIRYSNLFGYLLTAKLAAAYTSWYSEPSINRSYSAFMLTQLSPQDAFKFLPSEEVQSYNNIAAMQQQEFTSRLELDLKNAVSLNADFSVRNTRDNVFPVYTNNLLVLKNMADTRYRGFELQLDLYRLPAPTKYFSLRNSVSFYTYATTVTRVRDGYDSLPLAGFSTVHKALIKGQPLGVIVGPSIIGNPTPDFTLKLSHALSWKKFYLNIDWEYQKGGDIWNGTQAMLDKSYIQKADNIRIRNCSLAYEIKGNKYYQKLRLTFYSENLLLWTAYKGADPNQLLYDQPGSAGLDFFNLPSTKSFGANVSIQF